MTLNLACDDNLTWTLHESIDVSKAGSISFVFVPWEDTKTGVEDSCRGHTNILSMGKYSNVTVM